MTKVTIGHNAGPLFIEDEQLSLAEQGYEFQFRLTRLILERLRGFTTVTLKDMSGNIVTLETYRKKGSDGGLDLVIEIDAKTEKAARAVGKRVRAILLSDEIR